MWPGLKITYRKKKLDKPVKNKYVFLLGNIIARFELDIVK